MLSKNYLYIFIEYNIQDPDPRPQSRNDLGTTLGKFQELGDLQQEMEM